MLKDRIILEGTLSICFGYDYLALFVGEKGVADEVNETWTDHHSEHLDHVYGGTYRVTVEQIGEAEEEVLPEPVLCPGCQVMAWSSCPICGKPRKAP